MADCPHKERRQHLCFSSDIDLPDLTIKPDESHLTVDFARRHEFPTTKHYAVKYRMVATTRYREYYDPKFVAKPENITIRSEESQTFHILNTVPPPAPDFVYVLPILIHEQEAAVAALPYGKKKPPPTRRKIRRGLRVYMRRNWYLSGQDEKLAVVFAPSSPTPETKLLDADPENQLPMTEWGTNPIWYTTPIKRQPTVDDALVETGMRFDGIKIAKKSVTSALAEQRDAAANAAAESRKDESALQKFRQPDQQVVLDADSVQTVDVAAFAVHCDHDKDLVYADIEFKDTESYSLMVKMSLARFQPYSAPYAHLSSLTSWAFQAISPERAITYVVVSEVNENSRQATEQLKFTISGTAPGDSRQGFRENSLEVLLFDGDQPVSESQVPLRIDNMALGFRIPMKLLDGLKRPSLHIKEFEYVGNRHPRLVLAVHVPLNV
ncbi:MAG: hypothetical protein E6G97_21835 [Alphaproteobacteria bacterium]|nr:MAG: hypothetical protein E6G97_21835 [Alphaproteobacteria bacterium]